MATSFSLQLHCDVQQLVSAVSQFLFHPVSQAVMQAVDSADAAALGTRLHWEQQKIKGRL
jgi:hypothetical protein